jgi:polysaccharide export outer membrane protein
MFGWARRFFSLLVGVVVLMPLTVAFADTNSPDLITVQSQTTLSPVSISSKSIAQDLPEECHRLLKAGDHLRLTVWGEPDLSFESLTISPEGTLDLPLVKTIKLSDLNPREAEARLAQVYIRFLRQPKISVTRLPIEENVK